MNGFNGPRTSRVRTLARAPIASISILATAAALVVVTGGTATAAVCAPGSGVSYTPATNRIYLQPSGSAWTLPSIVNACAGVPITQDSGSPGTWYLNGSLILENGAALSIHGSSAGVPGFVDTLRLRSDPSNLKADVVEITAQWGTIDIDSVHIESWDSTANSGAGGTDDDPFLPAGSPTSDRGRAFIRAVSYLDSSDVARESTMDIANSELDHLGYYGGEVSGVAYEARGCGTTPARLQVCKALKVYGSQTNSHFHDNMIGTYLWGAYGAQLTGSSYDHNTLYGIYGRDVSRQLVVDGNHASYNGSHGIFFSLKSRGLTITNNEVDHNGLTPYTGMSSTGPLNKTPQDVNGILLHRGVRHATVNGNTIHDQPNGAGIVIFDSAANSLSDNTITSAKYGVRLVAGASGNTFTRTSISGSDKFGIYAHTGSARPKFTKRSGRPTHNVFTHTVIDGSGGNVVKLVDSDRTILTRTKVTGASTDWINDSSHGTLVRGGPLPAGQRFVSTSGATLKLVNPKRKVSVEVDAQSATRVISTSGRLFRVGTTALPTLVKRHSSRVVLTAASVGTSPVAVSRLKARASVSRGSAVVRSSLATSLDTFVLSRLRAGAKVTLWVGGLTPGQAYPVKRGGVTVARPVADSHGWITVHDRPRQSRVEYRVSR